ncbi:hypothetical protein D9M71_238560 [compost metagenome]
MALAAKAEKAGNTQPMPQAETKKLAQSISALLAKAAAAKPRAERLAPTRIIRSGGHCNTRTSSCATISATPTMVRAMPAVCAASAGFMPKRSRAKKPTVICATETLSMATKATSSGRRKRGSARRTGRGGCLRCSSWRLSLRNSTTNASIGRSAIA